MLGVHKKINNNIAELLRGQTGSFLQVRQDGDYNESVLFGLLPLAEQQKRKIKIHRQHRQIQDTTTIYYYQ